MYVQVKQSGRRLHMLKTNGTETLCGRRPPWKPTASSGDVCLRCVACAEAAGIVMPPLPSSSAA